MKLYSAIVVIGIALLIIVISSWSMLLSIDNVKCTKITIPSFQQMMDGWVDNKFAITNSRYVAEAIAASKIADIKDKEIVKSLNTSKLTDTALYGIITSDILKSNLSFIAVLNHPRYAECIRDYNIIKKQFKGLRGMAILILAGYNKDANTWTDDVIYKTLING